MSGTTCIVPQWPYCLTSDSESYQQPQSLKEEDSTDLENADAINEALQLIKDWNPTWNPDFFMVDFSEAEINAIERLFPSCLVYIWDFHRAHAWVRWINNSKKGINKDKKDNLLNSLRNLARTSTEGDFNLALRDLQDSELWRTNTRLQKWMNTTWLPERQVTSLDDVILGH